jgi:CheY-like chemotaxis protein
MSTKIILITQGFSFMGNSIQKSLEKAGYEVVRINTEVEELSEQRNNANILIFYLGKFIEDIPQFLVYLKDFCSEEEKVLILLGNSDELTIVQEVIPETSIAATFERPIDLKKLIQSIDKVAKSVDNNEFKRSILMVDDDTTFLKMMKNWLEKYYRVTIVTSGTQALMYLADNKPDLILLDYEMPVISGPQVLEMIRSEIKVGKVPVMFLTGKGDRESIMKVLALKPDGYLLKSLNREQILATLSQFFSKIDG